MAELLWKLNNKDPAYPYEAVGYTEDDVRELFRDWFGHAYDPKSDDAERLYTKWANFLDGGKDNG